MSNVGDHPPRANGAPPADDEIARRDLVGLIELGKKLAGVTEPTELLRLVLHEAIAVARAERGFVVLVRDGDFEFAVAENLDRSEIEQPAFEVSRSLIHRVIRTGEIEFEKVADLQSDHPAGGSLGGLGIRSFACVPIVGVAGVLGVLYLDSRSPGLGVESSNRKLLELFAGQAGAALENARAHRAKDRAIERAEERARRHRNESERRLRYGELVGASEAMQRVFERLDLIVPTDEPVVILGETGTGKELVAGLIHARGPRKDQELVAVNCAGLAETLLEGELFGHERGAFTGAERARPGLFELAHGGTLFLDEVADMSPRMQGDLLRVLQSGEVRRVGGRETFRVDVRLVAATNRDLEAEVREGRFRQDLFYRIHVLELRLPPLRDRPEDVPLLVEKLLPKLDRDGRVPSVSQSATARLMAYGWPGNVRELQNQIRRLVALGVAEIREEHLSAAIREPTSPFARAGTLREAEEEAIRRALEAACGNKAEAARALGIDRKTLRTKLDRMSGV